MEKPGQPPEWAAVDEYINGHLAPSDPALEAAREANAAAGLPAIDVTANQARLLQLLARLAGARRILEIGTLGGYSTIWMARALPADGRLVTLEVDNYRATVARSNIARAGLAHLVEVRVGPALESLAVMEHEGAEPFDLIFIDADKQNNANYLAWALKFARVGSVIVVDNVIRDGAVADAASVDPMVVGSRRLFEALAAEPRLSATALQTVGSKGYDGFAIALVAGAS
jgi:predicted O-methyltransferase YrrM